ncbi:thioredoxin domain-containing protein [Adhaeribacter terreus]|uniref:Thioredoxin domain-containing protein n=1 Tax=Adhaeribacter terreus TaxID=529703 RepID=A0ABW0EE45_9BACT
MNLINTEAELNAFFEQNEQAVITYFLETDCEGCEELLPLFEEISEETELEKISFGLMQAQPGSIAENLVKQREVPFVAIYKNGEMIKCGSVNSEKEFRKMLRKF